MTRSDTVQFCRYSVVGFSGFIVDFGIYALLTRGFSFWQTHNAYANFISFSCAVINNYIWHKRWTFRDACDFSLTDPPVAEGDSSAVALGDWKQGKSPLRQHGRQFLVFVVVSVIGLLLNTTILVTLSRQTIMRMFFGQHADLVAKMIAVPIVWMWNFGANKLWTFRKG
ncbi:MAG TPA: GtrA family protein [Armatimonadota bacterium]|nr:GtrA family protein [Armatimonadota bacterium]